MEDDLRAFRDALLSFSRYGYQEMIGWLLSLAVTGQPLAEWNHPNEYEKRLYTLACTLFTHLDQPNEPDSGVL